jgi:hypothetical protein|nr:MAG TPA: hypothetical protein [Caudoviricetes sp.]
MRRIIISEKDIVDLKVYIPDIKEKVENLDADDVDAFNDLLDEIDNIYLIHGIDENDEPNDIGWKYEKIRDRIFADNYPD